MVPFALTAEDAGDEFEGGIKVVGQLNPAKVGTAGQTAFDGGRGDRAGSEQAAVDDLGAQQRETVVNVVDVLTPSLPRSPSMS